MPGVGYTPSDLASGSGTAAWGRPYSGQHVLVLPSAAVLLRSFCGLWLPLHLRGPELRLHHATDAAIHLELAGPMVVNACDRQLVFHLHPQPAEGQ